MVVGRPLFYFSYWAPVIFQGRLLLNFAGGNLDFFCKLDFFFVTWIHPKLNPKSTNIDTTNTFFQAQQKSQGETTKQKSAMIFQPTKPLSKTYFG